LRSLPTHQRAMFATYPKLLHASISCHMYAFGEHHMHTTHIYMHVMMGSKAVA